jgi:hypothetical protein
MNSLSSLPRLPGLILLLLVIAAAPLDVRAQDRPTQRQLRTYIPPDQLVSFLPSTPFATFVDYINPIFERVTGKQVIDPMSHGMPIGISIAGMHFFDAMELVLEFNNLAYRETDRYFIVEEAVAPDLIVGAGQARAGTTAQAAATQVLASLSTREVQINAILFDLNLTKARDIGIDWNVFFGGEQGQAGQTGGRGATGGAGQQEERPQFAVRTDRFFESLSNFLDSPDRIQLSTLTQFFRLLEREDIGETVANPTISVQSGEKGRIQIGSDVPVQTRDFAGNTLTTFFSTGIIIDVTPTLITEALSDTLGGALVDFIHLNIHVEKSGSRPSPTGPIIDRNTADTRVLLLNGEQTIIGGLYSTEQSVSRRGIPILKDLPGWFFGLRYIFGYEQRNNNQKELLIVLQARLLDTLPTRMTRGDEDLLEKRRHEVERNLRRAGEEIYQVTPLPK